MVLLLLLLLLLLMLPVISFTHFCIFVVLASEHWRGAGCPAYTRAACCRTI
jgi:hypothetical protein